MGKLQRQAHFHTFLRRWTATWENAGVNTENANAQALCKHAQTWTNVDKRYANMDKRCANVNKRGQTLPTRLSAFVTFVIVCQRLQRGARS